MFLIEPESGAIAFQKAKYADFIMDEYSNLAQIVDSNEYHALKFSVRVCKFMYKIINFKIEKEFNETGYFNLQIDMLNWQTYSVLFKFNVLPSIRLVFNFSPIFN
jgi:hypothetical protein